MKIVLTAFIVMVTHHSFSQPETEIYIFELSKNGNSYKLSDPWNVSAKNPGYDNQPHFLPHGNSMYYVATRKSQTDVIEVEFSESSWAWLTATDGGEYSPTPMPDGSGFSAIRLDNDGTQLLYKYPHDFGEPTVIIPNLKIGYHCWFDEATLIAFVLGEVSTLQLCEVKSDKARILDKNIGRSIHKIPGKNKVSYVSKASTPWRIMELDPISGDVSPITTTLENSEDMAWTPTGDIIMGQDNALYKFSPEGDKNWIQIVETGDFVFNNITRIAISPNGDRIAVVVSE